MINLKIKIKYLKKQIIKKNKINIKNKKKIK